MSQPPQPPWNQPQPGWAQQPPAWGPQAPAWEQPPWGQPPPARSIGGQVPLLVLALVTAVLGVLGSFLPSYSYGDGLGSYAPLFQRFDDDTTFLATGLALLAGTALLVVGALLLRGRPAVGAGLVLFGAGIVVEQGAGNLLGLLQSLVAEQFSSDIAVGGVLLVLAGLTGIATAILALVTLGRARQG